MKCLLRVMHNNDYTVVDNHNNGSCALRTTENKKANMYLGPYLSHSFSSVQAGVKFSSNLSRLLICVVQLQRHKHRPR